jgi:hypothetical protein
LGCVRPERRSGTSCYEAIHAAVENAKARNYARLCLAAAPVFAIFLLKYFRHNHGSSFVRQETGSSAILLALAHWQLDLKNGPFYRYLTTNQ